MRYVAAWYYSWLYDVPQEQRIITYHTVTVWQWLLLERVGVCNVLGSVLHLRARASSFPARVVLMLGLVRAHYITSVLRDWL